MRESRKLEQAGAAPLRDDRDAVTPVGGLKDAAVHGSPRRYNCAPGLGPLAPPALTVRMAHRPPRGAAARGCPTR